MITFPGSLENEYSQRSHPSLAESTGSKFFARNCRMEIQVGHVIFSADMLYLHHNVAAKVAVNRPTAVMRSRLAHTAAADGKANDCNNCSLPFPFRTKALRGGACTSPRSTCERARRKLGNPVNSLCTATRVQSRSARDRAMGMLAELIPNLI